MELVAIEEIRQLKYRYFRTLDLKEWEEFGDCLADDISARYGTQAMSQPLHFDSRADVVAYMAENLSTSVISILEARAAHRPARARPDQAPRGRRGGARAA